MFDPYVGLATCRDLFHVGHPLFMGFGWAMIAARVADGKLSRGMGVTLATGWAVFIGGVLWKTGYFGG